MPIRTQKRRNEGAERYGIWAQDKDTADIIKLLLPEFEHNTGDAEWDVIYKRELNHFAFLPPVDLDPDKYHRFLKELDKLGLHYVHKIFFLDDEQSEGWY